MVEALRMIISYLTLFFIIMMASPTINAKETDEFLGKCKFPKQYKIQSQKSQLPKFLASSDIKDNDSFFRRGFSHQRLTKDIIQTIGRGLLDPGVISFFGPLLMAGLVALPFLAPSAIIPLAGLLSSVRGRNKRDLEETLGNFVVKELPDIINRVISKNQKDQKTDSKKITLEDIQRKLEEVIRMKDVRKISEDGKK